MLTKALMRYSRLQHLGRQLTQQPRPILLRQLQENLIDALPFGIPNSAKPIARKTPRNGPGDIADNEPKCAATHSANDGPEPGRRASARDAVFTVVVTGETLLAEHFLEHGLELVVGALSAVAICVGGSKSRPGKSTGDVFVLRGFPGCVVFAPSRRVGKGEVCIGDILELAGASGAFGGVGGDTVRVGLEGFPTRSQLKYKKDGVKRPLVCVADLLRGCVGGNPQDFVCERSEKGLAISSG